MSADTRIDRAGLWGAVASFVLWGLMPLYWHLLKAVPSLQIVLHRIVWSALLVALWLVITQGGGWWRKVKARPRAAALLGVTSVLITFNWGLYIWAVNAGHVIEGSLGYYINPLVNVVLGVAVLRERLNVAQWVAVGLAGAGVLWLTVALGQLPWIALGLALSFAAYGLLRKILAVDAVIGLGVEGAYLFLPALVALVWFEVSGQGHFTSGWGLGIDLLLVLGGALTALPLIGFAFAVRRVPYTIVGMLQYISPTLQLLVGALVLGEAFPRERMLGFALIWLGLAVFAFDGWRQSRRRAPLGRTPLEQ
jgi:chloramphenicol-sensitive protein RarD